MIKYLLAVSLALFAVPALAQSQTVRQSGTVTNTHVACWTTQGVVQDCGTSTAAFPSTFGVTKNGGLPFCVQDTAIHTGPYRQFCTSVSSSGVGTLSLTGYNGAAPSSMEIVIDGVTYTFPQVIPPPPIAATPLRQVTSGSTDTVTGADANGTVAWNSAATSAKTETLPQCQVSINGFTVNIVDEIGTGAAYPITVSSVSNINNSSSGYVLPFNLLPATFKCNGVAANWVVIPTAPVNAPVVANIAALQALGAASSQYPYIQVLGYNTAGDGGGGLFSYTVSVITPDSCVNFAPSAWTGTWVRVYRGITLQMCGAKPDGSTNARDALAAADALSASYGAILVTGGTFAIASNITITHAYTFDAGGIWKPGSGATITCNCSLSSGNYQIFDITGGGLIRGSVNTPIINVGWFNSDGSNTQRNSAFQAALDLAVNSTYNFNSRVSLCGASPSNRAIYTIDTGVTVTGNDLPNIEGCAPNSLPSPDSINLIMSPGSPAAEITFVGNSSGASCGCGVRGIFFDGNSNTTGVKIKNTSGYTLANNSASGAIGTMYSLHDGDGAGNFSENGMIYGTNIAGLSTGELFVDFQHDSGTGSFAGTQFGLNNFINLNPGARTKPAINIGSGAYPYNGCANLNVHNNGATSAYIFDNNESGQQVYFSCGTFQLEGSNTNTIGLVNPAHSVMYFGNSAITQQGMNNADISNATFCRDFSYNISISCQGGAKYTLTNSAAGNLNLSMNSGMSSSASQMGFSVSNQDNSYVYTGVLFCQDGGATVINPVQTTDTHSYGVPVGGFAAGVCNIHNASWPGGSTFTVTYTAITQ